MSAVILSVLEDVFDSPQDVVYGGSCHDFAVEVLLENVVQHILWRIETVVE
jgi:hypothetical protein